MEALRQEIRDEMTNLRINKKHVYDVLMRLVDEIDRTPSQAPVSEPEPVVEAAPEPVEEVVPEPVEETPSPTPVKKVVRRIKKKVEGEEAVLR